MLNRNGQMDEFLRIKIKSEFGDEEQQNLIIPSATTARNFNFNEPLYLGGIPNEIRVRFAENIISKYGIQVSVYHVLMCNPPCHSSNPKITGDLKTNFIRLYYLRMKFCH